MAADAGRARSGDRHGAPRPAQRAGAHRRAAVRDDLRRVRGRAARRGRTADARRRHRRREVPPRRRGRVPHRRAGRAITVSAGSQPEPPRVRRRRWSTAARGPRQTQRRGREALPRPDRPRCRSSSTATPPSPARASWPRRSTSARSRATAPAARSTSSPTTRSASPPTCDDARSTRYASDLAKGFDIPIIHVNADDPEACLARGPAGDGLPARSSSRTC